MMNNRCADPRTMLFAGDEAKDGGPLPMTVEVLRARTQRWPVSSNTPDEVASLLQRARQMFVDGYYTYENFADAATRSLQAVEAALRVLFGATRREHFVKLIDQARKDGLVDEYAHDVLHTGRKLRNHQIHATTQEIWTPALAASVIRTSHTLVAELFGKEHS